MTSVSEDRPIQWRALGIAAALQSRLFRRIWLASLISNLGLLVLGVGAAWSMTQMTPSADLVALVQTSMMLPIMLFAIPAGAIADMYDRRVVALVALGICFVFAVALTIITLAGFLTPAILLVLIFLIGSGMSLTGPASQASIAEQVLPAHLPSAIALSAISFNLARSIGPAVGGVVVAAAGALSAFGFTAITYLPMFFAFLLWKRKPTIPRLPPERLGRAIVSGVRFLANSSPIRIILARMSLGGLAFGSQTALMPLVSRDLLHGGAGSYGLLLGAIGVGAVGGAVGLRRVRSVMGAEAIVATSSTISGLCIIGLALSANLALSLAIMAVSGAVWTLMASMLNIGVQLSSPRWVAGRCLASFNAAAAGSIGLGAWIWGHVAQANGVRYALIASGITLIATIFAGLWLRTPTIDDGMGAGETDLLPDPEVQLALTQRSGPIIVEIEYRVPPNHARAFYGALQNIRPVRLRNGGYGWSVARDIADPELWTERFACPTWLDYLHQRARSTQGDRVLEAELWAFHVGEAPIRIQRMLERPFGSVRWKDDAPDPGYVGTDGLTSAIGTAG